MEGRVVSKEEAIESLRSNYSNEEIEVIFAYHTDYPIIEVGGRLRWEQRLDWIHDNNVLDPNDMVLKYIKGEITQKEYMEYYRQIGHSLYGYWEVFVFNDRFDWDQWNIDKIKYRDKTLNKILGE